MSMLLFLFAQFYFICICDVKILKVYFVNCQFCNLHILLQGQFVLSFTYLVSLFQALGHVVWSLSQWLLRLDCFPFSQLWLGGGAALAKQFLFVSLLSSLLFDELCYVLTFYFQDVFVIFFVNQNFFFLLHSCHWPSRQRQGGRHRENYQFLYLPNFSFMFEFGYSSANGNEACWA